MSTETALCACGGNHGIVPVYQFMNERGRIERHCLPGYNARFSDCPGCKGRIMDGRCPRGCRSCSAHGWHEGRDCPGCRTQAEKSAATRNTFLWAPMRWSLNLWAFVGFGAVLMLGYLLALPFVVMLGRWFQEHHFARIGWAVIFVGPVSAVLAVLVPIIVAVGLALLATLVFKTCRRE